MAPLRKPPLGAAFIGEAEDQGIVGGGMGFTLGLPGGNRFHVHAVGQIGNEEAVLTDGKGQPRELQVDRVHRICWSMLREFSPV